MIAPNLPVRRPDALVSLAIGVIVVLCDQLTKHLAADALSGTPDAGPTLLDGLIRFTFITNTGAAFGVLADRTVLYALILLVVAGVFVAYWRFLPRRHPALRVSLGLQAGGAIGNLVDRVREGRVTDFIEFKFWPVFNLADASLVAGVAILLWYLLTPPSPPSSGRASDEPQE